MSGFGAFADPDKAAADIDKATEAIEDRAAATAAAEAATVEKPETKPETKPEPKPEPETKPETKPEPKKTTRKRRTATKKADTGDVDADTVVGMVEALVTGALDGSAPDKANPLAASESLSSAIAALDQIRGVVEDNDAVLRARLAAYETLLTALK